MVWNEMYADDVMTEDDCDVWLSDNSNWMEYLVLWSVWYPFYTCCSQQLFSNVRGMVRGALFNVNNAPCGVARRQLGSCAESKLCRSCEDFVQEMVRTRSMRCFLKDIRRLRCSYYMVDVVWSDSVNVLDNLFLEDIMI